MQLNMGKGKSSVIVPIVAASLADGACLVRALVTKPQSRQMFDMLVLKLSGLLGRRVYHLPISRSLRIDEQTAFLLNKLSMMESTMCVTVNLDAAQASLVHTALKHLSFADTSRFFDSCIQNVCAISPFAICGSTNFVNANIWMISGIIRHPWSEISPSTTIYLLRLAIILQA